MKLVIKSKVPIGGVQGDNSSKEERNKVEDVYHKGFEDGLRIGKEETIKIREKLISVIQDVLEEKQNIFGTAEAVILKLASVISRKIIYKEINTDSEIILNVVREILKSITDRSKIVLKVNPQDINLVKGNSEEWNGLLDEASNFDITSDMEIEKGGCLVDTSLHEIDATIESKLRKIDEILGLLPESSEI